ncbi:hypothetical protein SGCOL_005396 [Colletotrichum sp. CLE4]
MAALHDYVIAGQQPQHLNPFNDDSQAQQHGNQPQSQGQERPDQLVISRTDSRLSLARSVDFTESASESSAPAHHTFPYGDALRNHLINVHYLDYHHLGMGELIQWATEEVHLGEYMDEYIPHY